MNYYLSKPVRFPFLLQRMSELLDNANQIQCLRRDSLLEEEEKEEIKQETQILIADDDSFSSGILKQLLEREKFKCFQTFSMREVILITIHSL